jgi:hypothetical protein
LPLESTQSNLFSDALENAYRVQIEEFEGPLDLLLHLIKKNEVDIYNIPIAAITRQYLEYMELMKELNLDIAGEFLVMAATLLQIKSRMLLPVQKEEEEAELGTRAPNWSAAFSSTSATAMPPSSSPPGTSWEGTSSRESSIPPSLRSSPRRRNRPMWNSSN